MITLTTEQAQQIEEALEDIVRVFKFETGTPVEALDVIRAARAQWQAEQEPVAWMHKDGCVCSAYDKENMFGHEYFNIPLYTNPVRTKDLTDDEIHELVLTWENHALARAVIAAYKEKNK